MPKNELKNLVLKNKQDVIDFRRDLHIHPEPSNEEIRTTARISEELTKAGIEHRVLSPSGVIAEVKGALPGRTVALRGDMDALQMDELNECEYKSKIPGRMHACGHDAHTAMLLGAAKALSSFRDHLKGNVRFLFQPAEEVAEGALRMIAEGCMKGVDNVFGMHVNPLMATHTAAVDPGPFYASADILKITFTGKGGHGAQPQDTVDALVMAADFVMKVQTIVSRKLHPFQPAVVTIGKLESGTRFNIIAETAVLEGTVRCFDLAVRDEIEKLIKHYADHTAKLYGGLAEVQYTYGTIPVINDENSALFAQKIIKATFGDNALVKSKMTTGGEDFSYFLQEAPGAFASLGVGHPGKNPDAMVHHGKFDIDEDALAVGTELLCQYAYEYLNQN